MGARVLLGLILLLLPALISPALIPTIAAAHPPLLLQKTWGGSGYDRGRDLGLDASGNAYVVGSTGSFRNATEILLMKYNSVGSLLWQETWAAGYPGYGVGMSLAVDSSNNVYVTGFTNATGGGVWNGLLLKLNSSGSLIWQKTWIGSNGGPGYSVADDDSGNIYVTGQIVSFGAGENDVFLLKFNSTGVLLWEKTWGGIKDDAGRGVVVDSSGNIYVAGYTSSFGAGGTCNFGSYACYDTVLLKFNSTGNLLWQKTWGGSNVDDFVQSLAVDASDHIYVTGYTRSYLAGDTDVFLLKFNPSGSLEWQKAWRSSSDNIGDDLAVDSSSNAYVTGYTEVGSGCPCGCGAPCNAALLLKFNSSGGLLWQKTWGGSGYEEGSGVGVDSLGNAWVTGWVGEAPPYTLNNPKATLVTPDFIPGVPYGVLHDPGYTPTTPTGTIQTIIGNESYSGSGDAFLIESSPLGAPPILVPYTPHVSISPMVVVLAALTAPSIFILARRRRVLESEQFRE